MLFLTTMFPDNKSLDEQDTDFQLSISSTAPRIPIDFPAENSDGLPPGSNDYGRHSTHYWHSD